ncbi:hypothetical protein AJ79_07310 [Helicocarpus griseus UAMH5409]|uniref:Serine hydrolase domain-containing protein n=1 Tax=Helicocarpus griseus UAMH5409 TaxID=1447875 RepID=A0A2B7X405_9EURO|nr:hypothetical protein AJ79_07310 [Helicocarpus griseus UAMH5409]
MRFLCLHGFGTNSQIFKIQTASFPPTCALAAIRYELGDGHEYEFVEGCVPWPAAPEIKSLLPSTDETFAYYDPTSPASILKAIDDLETYIETEGPFDGVLGFSHGASLAASFIARKHHQDHLKPVFKCAILISAPPAMAWQGLSGAKQLRILDADEDGELIQMPTAIIWGRQDPYLGAVSALGTVIPKLCGAANRVEYVHGGGHEVPSSSSMEVLAGSVKMIKRVIDMAHRWEAVDGGVSDL